MLSTVLVALTSALAVFAQTNHTVMVGQGGPVFVPDNVQAAPGDIINFMFVAKTHSVTQSTFKTPCTAKPDGIDSELVDATTATDGNVMQWAFRVDDAAPLWFYCKFGAHCAAGMVFAVNPNATLSMDQYIANAKGSANGTATNGTATTGGTGNPSNGNSSDTTTAPSETPSGSAVRSGTGAISVLALAGLVMSFL
jgi:plastocyanin